MDLLLFLVEGAIVFGVVVFFVNAYIFIRRRKDKKNRKFS